MKITQRLMTYLCLCTQALYCMQQIPVKLKKNKFTEVETCLINCYRVDQETAASITLDLIPLINNEMYHPVIDTFIEKAEKLHIPFTNNSSPELLSNDAVLKASLWHTVLFENAHIRILRGVVKSSEYVPPHTHQWNGLMVVIQGAIFRTEYSQETVEIDNIAIGVYEKHGEKNLSGSSINIGNTLFESLLFEVKI